jgi:hypothetical protein
VSEEVLLIAPDGTLRFIYSDTLAKLFFSEGKVSTRRASHVEPEGNRWVADLSPVGGPRLGPFDTRAEALTAERDWLLEHHIPFPNKVGVG